jgi:hypothetical protein
MPARDPSAARSQCQLPAAGVVRVEYDFCDWSGVHAMPQLVLPVAACTGMRGFRSSQRAPKGVGYFDAQLGLVAG